MADPLGAIVNCITILVWTKKTIDNVKDALEQAKHATEYVNRVQLNLKATISAVEIVQKEPEFQKDHIFVAVDVLTQNAKKFQDFLVPMEKQSKTPDGLGKFLHFFRKGKDEQKQTDVFVANLDTDKITLVLALLVSQPGIIRSAGKVDIGVDLEALNKANQRMNAFFDKNPDLINPTAGVTRDLRLLILLRERGKKDPDGNWVLCEKDLEELEQLPPYSAERPKITIKKNQLPDYGTVVGGGVRRQGEQASSTVYDKDISENIVNKGSLIVGEGVPAEFLHTREAQHQQKEVQDQILKTFNELPPQERVKLMLDFHKVVSANVGAANPGN